MNTRPILMSAPMVLANIARRKTQTRRMTGLKSIPEGYEFLGMFYPENCPECRKHGKAAAMFGGSNAEQDMMIPCPYGTIGDQLWVRESFVELCAVSPSTDAPIKIGRGMRLIEKPTSRIHNGKKVWNYDGLVVAYRADSDVEFCDGDGFSGEFANKQDMPRWKPSIHMPRKYSRIMLEITNIRVERLQDITEDDAIDEGIDFEPDYDLWMDYERKQWFCVDPIDSYKSLINSINGAKAWDSNPWVWVVEYKIIEIKGGAE